MYDGPMTLLGSCASAVSFGRTQAAGPFVCFISMLSFDYDLTYLGFHHVPILIFPVRSPVPSDGTGHITRSSAHMKTPIATPVPPVARELISFAANVGRTLESDYRLHGKQAAEMVACLLEATLLERFGLSISVIDVQDQDDTHG
jgi:hypothetical protein